MNKILIQDKETGQEITLEGNRKLDNEEFEFVNKIAPACVYTEYEEVICQNNT